MTASVVFLAVSLWGALFTLNALHPLRRFWLLIGISFFPAWITTELPIQHLVWQGVATVLFVWAGALDHWPGWVGLAVTLTSWSGLVAILRAGYGTGTIIRRALDEALGTGHDVPPVDDGTEWRRVLLPVPLRRRRRVERIRNLQYADDGIRRHRCDVYRRRGLSGPAPVLLQIHGGGWMIGNKDQQGLPLMAELAAHGWVCVAINYRLSPRATWPDHLVDCKRALAWIREHIAVYGGDPTRVVVTGGSAGGHLTAMMGLTANDPAFQPGFEDVDTSVSGFVPFYGVFDFTDRYGIRGRDRALLDALERFIVKRPIAEARDVYDAASPISRVRADAPPCFVLHGTNDTLAPVAEARHFVAELRSVSRAPVAYAEFRGAHHAFDLFPSLRAVQAFHGVEAFATWCVSDAGSGGAGARSATSDPTTRGRTAP